MDNNIDINEEYQEEDDRYGVMEGNKDMMEPPNTRNPPARCPRPLYSRDYTQEGHTIPHHHQVDEEQSLIVSLGSVHYLHCYH